MDPVNARIRIQRAPLSAGIARLQESISSYERNFHCTSAEMLQDVKAGSIQETAEISTWLCKYHVLNRLETGK